MKRVMCVYLPKWPLQRLAHGRPELRGKAVVLADALAARGPRVVLCSAMAARAGVRPGMPVAEALAIDPQLFVEDADPAGDVESLQQLARWAERYSPLVGLEEGPDPRSLLLDITGCAACFHGEDRLLERAVRELTEQGWTARIAIADTVGAAWGLARYGRTPCLAPEGQAERFLDPLPVAALRLPGDTLDLLTKLGLERVGQLTGLPRPELVPRFGPTLLRRLDQALGRLPELVQPHRFVPPVQAALSFEHPTDRRQALDYALDELTGRIQEDLRGRNWGARQIECWVYHETAPPLRVEVNLFRPGHSVQHLRKLLHARLEQVSITEPVCGVRLHVSGAEPLSESQAELFEPQPPDGSEGLPALIDGLGSRLGHEAVTRAALVADAQPEYACRFEPLVQTGNESSEGGRNPKQAEGKPELLPRPLRLWPAPIRVEVVSVVPDGPPVQFRWAGVSYRIARAWGPERIETGWWRSQEARRDYYVVVTHLGNRFWLFRHRDDSHWFLHGCFD